jgi:hypothetical protein
MKTISKANVLKELKRAGLKVSEYARNPSPGTHFIINDDNGRQIRLFMNEKEAQVTNVSGNKQFKQAVISVTEGARSLKFNGNVKLNLSDIAVGNRWNEKKGDYVFGWLSGDNLRKKIEKQVKIQVSDQLPHFTEKYWTGVSISNSEALVDDIIESIRGRRKKMTMTEFQDAQEWGTYAVKASYNTRGTKICVLMGVDESSYFVSVLPRQCKTVLEAHAALRPKNVSAKAKRQGEWFLDPVDNKTNTSLNSSIAKSIGSTFHRSGMNREVGRTHNAALLFHRNGVEYANIAFSERRPNRHKTINLDRWHRIVRNREIEMPMTRSGNRNVD